MDKVLAEQEIMKKEREIQICEPLVHHLNSSERSDYYLRSAKYYCEHDDHLVDVTLYSRSGRFSERHVQVVTAPSDRHRELRYSNDNVSKIQKRLEKYLADAGIVDSEVRIFLSEAAVRHKTPAAVWLELAKRVQKIHRPGIWNDSLLEEGAFEEGAFSEQLSKSVHALRGVTWPGLGLRVCPRIGGWSPCDGTLIEEAINNKSKKYAKDAVAKMSLLVDGGTSLRLQQVEDFRLHNRRNTIPFAEAWIVLASSQVIQLK